MSDTSKIMSGRDAEQTLRSSYNNVNATLGVDGFIVGKVGRKVVVAITTTTIASDTEVYTFSESGTQLYVITLVYTDGTRNQLISAERTA